MSFEQWVRDNWPVKLDIIKGDFQGDPNSDSSVANYSVYPALLFDTFDNNYHLRYPNEWSRISEISGSGDSSGGDSGSGDSSGGEIQLDNLLNFLEEGEGISISRSFGNKGEIKKVRLESEGLLKVSHGSNSLTTLLDSLEAFNGDVKKSFPAISSEGTKLRYIDKGNVSISPSDKGSSNLFDKLQAGEGLSLYKQRDNEDEESLEVGLDNETLKILYDLKYRRYARETEQRRNLDIYVDVKTAPYKGIRDGSVDRPYLSIKEAVESEQAQNEQCTICVFSGLYIEEAPITLPPSTSVIGSE